MTSRIFIAIFAILQAGCVSLLPDPGPDPKRYSLSLVSAQKSTQVNPAQITVEEPKCSMDLDSTRVVVVQSGERSFVSNREWNERLPLMLQSIIINNLEGAYRIVGRPDDGYIPDFVIIPAVQNFELEDLENVHVAIEYKVMHMKDRQVVRSKGYDVKVPVDGADFKDVIRGFNEALSQCMLTAD